MRFGFTFTLPGGDIRPSAPVRNVTGGYDILYCIYI